MKNLIFILSISFLLTGCVTTIAPQPVTPSVASYAGTNSNGGIISTIINKKGEVEYVIINKEARDNYNSLIKQYGNKILPKLNKNDGITPLPNGNFAITGEYFGKFSKMVRMWKKDNESN